MNVAAVQFRPELFNLKRNMDFITDVSQSNDAELIVFPELSTCGYYYESFEQSRSASISVDDPFFSSLQKLATQKQCSIVLGFAERSGDHVFNSAMVIMADATQTRTYRKSHLFYKEKYCFHQGDTGFFVVDDKQHDLRIGTMICYDWRFPEAARTLALRGADIIVCPSNLVTKIWTSVMPTRAIENKVYLVVANRWGTEITENETLSFNGQSAIYSFNGEVLASAPAEGDCIIMAEIDALATRDKSFNSENDIFHDRRSNLYQY